MKDFFARVLSSAAGCFLAGAIVVIMFVFVSLMSTLSTPGMSDKSVLRLDLQGVVTERSSETPLDFLGMGDVTPSLETMLGAIKEAKTNSKIAGIYINAGALGASPATLQELRKAIADFRKSGKFVVSYGGTYTQGAYYVCSAASRVILNPIGEVEWRGMASENIFFKDLLKKIGVEMQVIKVGSYKSATEPFTASEMSPENREQVTQYVSGIWNTIKKDVSSSRKVSVQVLDSLADGYLALKSQKEMLASKLVDTLAYEDGALEYVASLVGAAKAKDIAFVDMDAVNALSREETTGSEIAVYYMYGDIVSNAEQGGMYDDVINAESVIDDLAALADDENVKAVVLRVNSGGGSAYASEQIWHSVKKLAARKPVVVSMGGMAASGAYYLSAGANYVFAEPTTLTGSIGIFGIIPDVSGLLKDKLGLRFDGVKTNRHADFFTTSRPLDEPEKSMLQSYVDRGYDLFVKRVADGRRLSEARVREIAQGRVYTGEDALKIRLVDRLGTLDDAVAEAAKRAKVSEYGTVHYPKQKTWFEQLVEEKTGGYMEAQLREYLGEYHSAFMLVRNIGNADRIQARIPYEPVIK